MPSLQARAINLFARALIEPQMSRRISVDEMRAYAQAIDRGYRLADGLSLTPASLRSCAADWIAGESVRTDRVVLYLPGGAWAMRTPRAHRNVAGHIALAARARALIVFYRLAPEHPFPAALEDALAAYERLLEQGHDPQRIVIGGDSAGGNLTLATLMALRDRGRPLPAAAFTISPATDLTRLHTASASDKDRADPSLSAAGERAVDIASVYVGGRSELLVHPHVSPLRGDPGGLPPLFMQVGSREALLDDSRLFYDKARAAGVDVELEIWDRLPHVWHLFPVPERQRAITHIADFIRRCCP